MFSRAHTVCIDRLVCNTDYVCLQYHVALHCKAYSITILYHNLHCILHYKSASQSAIHSTLPVCITFSIRFYTSDQHVYGAIRVEQLYNPMNCTMYIAMYRLVHHTLQWLVRYYRTLKHESFRVFQSLLESVQQTRQRDRLREVLHFNGFKWATHCPLVVH